MKLGGTFRQAHLPIDKIAGAPLRAGLFLWEIWATLGLGKAKGRASCSDLELERNEYPSNFGAGAGCRN
jgi:hypothetical protein